MDIFVGNIAFSATEADVRNIFAVYGMVDKVTIITEKHSSKSRGFGFVTMPHEQEALSAMKALQGKELLGRPLNVGLAKSKPSAPKVKTPDASRSRSAADEQNDFFPEEDSEGESGNTIPVEKTGGYKTGRRSRTYMQRQGMNKEPAREGGYQQRPGANKKPWGNKEQGAKPWQKKPFRENPWQHKKDAAKPWQKNDSSQKPWEKNGESPKPWQKKDDGAKPWQKKEKGASPWRKRKGSAKVKGADQKAIPWWQQKDRSQQYKAFKKKKF